MLSDIKPKDSSITLLWSASWNFILHREHFVSVFIFFWSTPQVFAVELFWFEFSTKNAFRIHSSGWWEAEHIMLYSNLLQLWRENLLHAWVFSRVRFQGYCDVNWRRKIDLFDGLAEKGRFTLLICRKFVSCLHHYRWLFEFFKKSAKRLSVSVYDSATR